MFKSVGEGNKYTLLSREHDLVQAMGAKDVRYAYNDHR